MQLIDLLADMLGGDAARLLRENASAVTELRLRTGRPVQLRLLSGKSIPCEAVDAQKLRCILNRLMDNSMYACERELQQGYFTAIGGCRVGVCGKIGAGKQGIDTLGGIGSVCIRIPREVPGCADVLAEYVLKRPLNGMLILSPPGMGKTTLLRDLARTVSNRGHNVCIADERREIAACVEGVPQLDVGRCSDVMDGLEKSLAVPMLLRACAPDMIVVDELGGEADARAVLDARRSGAAVVATAHARSIREAWLRPGIGMLLRENVFEYCALLGPNPGGIEYVHECADARFQHAQGCFADHDTAGLYGGGQGTFQPEKAPL